MATTLSQGTLLKIGDGASPEVFSTIEQLVSISGPDGEAPVIPVTNLSSTAVEKRLGLKDEGNISVSGFWDAASTTHALLKSKFDSGAAVNFSLTFADSPATVLTFSAFVQTFNRPVAVDEVVGLEFTLVVSGAVTES